MAPHSANQHAADSWLFCNWSGADLTNSSAIFLSLVLLLFLGSVVRVFRTPPSDPVRGERADLAALLLLVECGAAGSLARDRFPVNSQNYWLANTILIPICLFALWYISRLIRAFRGIPTRSPKSTARVLTPPKLDQPQSDSTRQGKR